MPTTFVAPGQAYEVPAYEHVVTPTVSAGPRDTARLTAGESSLAHAQALLSAGRHVMVQPYVTAIDTDGETAVVTFDGAHSHAAGKAAVPPRVPVTRTTWRSPPGRRPVPSAHRPTGRRGTARRRRRRAGDRRRA